MVLQYRVTKVIHILMLFNCGQYTPKTAVMGDLGWIPIYHTHLEDAFIEKKRNEVLYCK